MFKTCWMVSCLSILSFATPAIAVQPQHPSRAALVIQDIDHKESNKIYEGVVRWSESTEKGEVHVKATIDISYFGGAVSADFFANDDPNKPYALIVDVAFPNSTIMTGMERIGVLEARSDAQQVGSVLAGNVFKNDGRDQIGITDGDVNTNNFDMILNDNWLEIPILFKSGLQGKITFEKGLSGQKEVTKLIETLKPAR